MGTYLFVHYCAAIYQPQFLATGPRSNGVAGNVWNWGEGDLEQRGEPGGGAVLIAGEGRGQAETAETAKGMQSTMSTQLA